MAHALARGGVNKIGIDLISGQLGVSVEGDLRLAEFRELRAFRREHRAIVQGVDRGGSLRQGFGQADNPAALLRERLADDSLLVVGDADHEPAAPGVGERGDGDAHVELDLDGAFSAYLGNSGRVGGRD